MEQLIANNKISVVTVVYNDVAHIRETMESYFSQTWEEREYIVIDGGSTDGTADIIKEYSDRLAYWCSKKDEGIYDAMNKGIIHCNGNWINILNSGDIYAHANSLKDAIVNTPNIDTVDIIYGNSIKRDSDDVFQEAGDDVAQLQYAPIYRHGSSLVRTKIHQNHLFDTSQSHRYGFALDWLLIHQLFLEGYKFQKADATIEIFLSEGVSNNRKQSLIYNRMITTGRKITITDKLSIHRQLAAETFKQSKAYKWIVAFLVEYVLNDWIPLIPFWICRKWFLKIMKMQINEGSFVMKRNYIMTPQKINIGCHSHINRGCTLDGRGGISIGNNVSVSYNVSILTGSHDYHSKTFRGKFLPVKIEDYAWIGANATILQNVTIGKGAVVCAGAVVTKNVEPYTIVAGIPAKKIGNREKDLDYYCHWDVPFT